jgi:UDPglucose 6-dehydrogenase
MAISALNIKDPSLVTEENLYGALANSDLILHLTEWNEYRNIDVAEISSKVRAKNIIDGRNVLDKQTWANAGWHITYLGKPGS